MYVLFSNGHRGAPQAYTAHVSKEASPSVQTPNHYEAVESLQLFHTNGRQAFPESSKPDRNTALLGKIRD